VKAGGIQDVFINTPEIAAVDVGVENNVRFLPEPSPSRCIYCVVYGELEVRLMEIVYGSEMTARKGGVQRRR